MLGHGHLTATCPECEGDVDGLAVWCGQCGAALPTIDQPRPAAHGRATQPEAAPIGPAPASHRPGRPIVVLVLLLALVVGIVVARPQAAGESLVGRLDVGAGPSATRAPPPGLEIAWRQQVESDSDGATYVGGAGPLVVRDGRAAVGGVVVDTASGTVVADLRGASLGGWWSAQGTTTVLHGDRLLVVDVLTGEVVHRRHLDPAGLAQPGLRLESVARAQAAGTTLFASIPRPQGWLAEDEQMRWALVRDGGDIVARGVGDPLRAGGDANGPPEYAVVSLRQPDTTGTDLGLAAWVVVDLGTGAEILRVEPGGEWSDPPQVVGGMAFVLAQDDSPPSWDVTLHDLDARQVRWQTQLGAEEPPALHAVTSTGDAVVATRDGDVLRVLVVDGDGPPTIVTEGPAPDPRDVLAPGATAMVAADGELVVMLDPTTGDLVATGLDGMPRWRTPVGSLPADALVDLQVSADLVALSVDGGQGPLLHLVDRVTGEVLHHIAPGRSVAGSWGELVVTAGVGGLVGVDRRSGTPRELAYTDWFDARTGRPRVPAHVVGGWLQGVELPPDLVHADGSPDIARFLGSQFSGTLRGVDGRVGPVLVPPAHDGRLDLLLGLATPVSIALPESVRPFAGYRRWNVVAVAVDWLVLQSTDVGGLPLTVRVDRATRAAVALPPLRSVGVAGTVLVGQREETDGSTGLVAVDLAEGDLRWEVPWTWGDVVVVDDRQVVTVAGADVVVRRPSDGTVAWRTELGQAVAGQVVVTEASVLLRTLHGDVVALDRMDGSVLWRHVTDRVVTTLGAAGEDTLVGTADGAVLHLDAAGEELQHVDVGLGPVGAVASLGRTIVVTLPGEVVGLRPDVTGIVPGDRVDLP